jgi:type IV secretion system protein VirD4
MPTQTPLYALPGSSLTLKLISRTFIFAALPPTLVASYMTQLVAARLDDTHALGRPLFYAPQSNLPATSLLAFAALVASLSVVALAVRGVRLFAVPGLLAAYASYCLAFGPLYQPLALLAWRFTHRPHPPLPLFVAPYLRVTYLSAALAAAGAALVLLFRLPDLFTKADVHGSARWANLSDLKATGVIPANPTARTIPGPEGIFLGLYTDPRGQRFRLYDNEPHHVMLIAPTRSGKGVGYVVPNLLNYRHSAVVLDVKRELYEVTSGFRAGELGQEIFLFDPTSNHTSRYNPLDEIRLGPYEVRDTQNIADLVVDPEGSAESRSHWQLTAHELLTATMLHLKYTSDAVQAPVPQTLAGCAQFLSDPRRPIHTTLQEMLNARHLPAGGHPLISSTARSMLDKAPEELSGVVSTALSYLSLYRDPLVAAATSTSDFRILDLVEHSRPVTLYIAVPPSDLTRTRPLLRLFLNQLCRNLTQTLDPKRREVLFLLDEFPALRRLLFFVDSLAYLAGYKVRALIVTQDMAQLQANYGTHESITANCQVRIAMTPNRPETAQILSNMLGTFTVHHAHTTRRSGGRLFESSTTPAEVKRPLLTPDEVLRLPADDALLFLSGRPPVRATRARYYQDSELLRRSQIPPAALSQPLRPSEAAQPLPKKLS